MVLPFMQWVMRNSPCVANRFFFFLLIDIMFHLKEDISLTFFVALHCPFAFVGRQLDVCQVYVRRDTIWRSSNGWLRQETLEHVLQDVVPRQYVRRHILVLRLRICYASLCQTQRVHGLHQRTSDLRQSAGLWPQCERWHHVSLQKWMSF